MNGVISQTEPTKMELLGSVLNKAALKSKVIIDAIPESASVTEECAVIDAATAPVFLLAKLILEVPCKNDIDEDIRDRAQAWMDGNYWSTLEATA